MTSDIVAHMLCCSDIHNNLRRTLAGFSKAVGAKELEELQARFVRRPASCVDVLSTIATLSVSEASYATLLDAGLSVSKDDDGQLDDEFSQIVEPILAQFSAYI